jgi:hypothetical protein
MGGNAFCMKVCDPAGANAAHYCEHVFDRIGCAYNAPNAAQDKVFVSCQGDDQDFPGVYTSNGVVMTYTQPAESLGPIATIPYTARIPASSNCVTFQSQALYTGLPSASSAPTTAAPGATPASGGSVNAAGASGTPKPSSSTGSSSTKSGALGLVASSMGSLASVILAIVFFA